MAKLNPIKVGIGTGLMLLGVYFVFNSKQEMLISIMGIIAIAFGVGLFASSKR